MSEPILNYTANAGQTYMPFQENVHVKTLPYEKLQTPKPKLKDLELNQCAKDKGWILQEQCQHFLPGVSAKMLDWFWANMEKCYYLWAPGSHKRFNWVKEPWKYGFTSSIHMISESVGEENPVFGGNGICIHRLGLDYFPFTTHLEHVICEGTFNDLGEFVDATIHMWEDCDGGCNHITAAVMNPNVQEPPAFVKEMIAADPTVKIVPPSSTDHAEYEASQWPIFLPTLYKLWENHPDPTQNVRCDLRVIENVKGLLEYKEENGPVLIK